jgi:hypothetical protein
MADWQGKRRMPRGLGKFRKRGESGEKKREREREMKVRIFADAAQMSTPI